MSLNRRRLAIALVASLAVQACAPAPQAPLGPTAAAAASTAGGNINVRLTGDWDVFDPSGEVIANVAGGQVLMGMYDRLTENPAKGDPVPYLAKSWKFTDSAT